jgi:lipopolysaccharide transport system ATP-binding protein
MAAVSALCSRAIVLDGGRVVVDGLVQDAVRSYIAQNIDQGAARWELESLRRPSADVGRVARLRRVAAHAAQPDGFAFGEPLRFRVTFASQVPLSHVVCALNLDDLSGTRVVTFESDDSAGEFDAAGPGRYELEVVVPPFGLRPGKYLLSASIYSGGHFYDYLLHFGMVSVLPFDLLQQRYVGERPDRGPICVRSGWRVVEASEAIHA